MSTSGLRERKKIATRRQIAAAALELAIEHGPDSITVHDIAAAADVSPRTVFNYFATKDEAILGHDPERRHELAAALADRPASESPLESLRQVLTEAVTEADNAGNIWLARARLVHQHPQLRSVRVASLNALELELARATAQRTGLDAERDAYPCLVSAVALTVVRMVLGRSANLGRSRLKRELDTAFSVLANGLALPPTGGRQ